MLLNHPFKQNNNAFISKNSQLLKNCLVFTVDMYLDVNGGTVEDLIGRRAYFTLVNLCYKLPRKYKLRTKKQTGSNGSIVKEVEEHFRSLPSSIPVLDLYNPAECLFEKGEKIERKLRDLNEAYSRFEAFFIDLNSCRSV